MLRPISIKLCWYWKRNSFHQENKKPASELMQAFLLTLCFLNLLRLGSEFTFFIAVQEIYH